MLGCLCRSTPLLHTSSRSPLRLRPGPHTTFSGFTRSVREMVSSVSKENSSPGNKTSPTLSFKPENMAETPQLLSHGLLLLFRGLISLGHTGNRKLSLQPAAPSAGVNKTTQRKLYLSFCLNLLFYVSKATVQSV